MNNNQSSQSVRFPVDRDPRCSRRNGAFLCRIYRRIVRSTTSRCAPFVAAALIAAPLRLSADVVLDTFERTNPSPWSFAKDGSPTGSLTLGPGHTGNSANLAFSFSNQSGFVSAKLSIPLPQQITAAAISLWLKAPVGIFARLRVIDGMGQTFQYTLNRPFTAMADQNAWYQYTVALNGPDDHFGGANDGVFRGKVTEVDLLAVDPLETAARGTISFDDVTVLTALTYTLDPTVRPILGTPRTGDMFSTMGVAFHKEDGLGLFGRAAAAGFKWARTDLFWSDVEGETKGRYDFTAFDQIATAIKAAGMQPLFILGYGNTLYTRQDYKVPPMTTEEVRGFVAYAKAAAAHYKDQGVRFELWNEGDEDGTFWDPNRYGLVAKDAMAAVHTGDLAAKVSTTGVGGFEFPYIRSYLNQGGGTNADAIAVHPYDVSEPFNGLVEKYLNLKNILAAKFSNPPVIWNTEWGFSSSNMVENNRDGHTAEARRLHASFVVRELLSCYAVGFPLSIYYDLRDDANEDNQSIPTESEHNFGLLDHEGRDKPAITAVSTLSRLTRGRTFVGFLPTVPTSLTAMKFDGGSDTVIALWLSAKGSSVSVAVPTGATVTNMLGASVPVQNGRIVVTETGGPVYVTARK